MSAPTPRSPLPPGPPGIRFGQVWESPDETIGSMRYLVVSSDAYNTAFGDCRVIAVEVDSRAVYQGAYREPVTDAGTAHAASQWIHLDRARHDPAGAAVLLDLPGAGIARRTRQLRPEA